MENTNIKDFINGFKAAGANLKSNIDYVNDLNVFPVPDGDTGTNMDMTYDTAVKSGLKSNPESIIEFLDAFSKGSLLGARGNSGVILSQLIRGFVEPIINSGDNKIDVNILSQAFIRSSEVAYNAVMKPIEGTILTISKDLATSAKKHKNVQEIDEFLDLVIEAGNKSLENTPNLLPVLKEAGVVDAGGKGYMILLEGVQKYLRGEVIESDDYVVQPERTVSQESDIEEGYCTEFLIHTNDDSTHIEKTLKEELDNLGDSMLVVGVDDIVKVHLHTNNPGKAIEIGLKYGELNEISIDNMRYQHQERLFSQEEYENNSKQEPEEEKEYGIITVSVGEGFNEIFESLGVDKIISGGQTMNPSTEELLEAVEEINAKDIYIFPNNSNIILSANQVADITEKSVHVVPTKSIPEGINGILNVIEGGDNQEILKNIDESLSNIKTGEITFAVRDTVNNGVEIKKDQILGIYNGEIVSKDNVLKDTVVNLLDKLYQGDEDSFIALYYGEDVVEEEAEELYDELSDKYPDVDIDLIFGGQPLYYYIISVENV